MTYQTKLAGLCLLISTLGTSALAAEPIQPVAASKPPVCQIVFDAGSSGTRLYVYEKQGKNWLEHAGPKVSALADPVREIRGKTHGDIDAVTSEVVTALDSIKTAGPVDQKGKAAWSAFDWSKQCQVTATMVLATAGMRVAEQENREKSIELWSNLKQKLQAKLGKTVKVNTRTLTGFEEGLFAWFSVREQKQTDQFGIAEMGGASAQVTFPCKNCDAKDDAVKTVLVGGKPTRIFSYSFLGLGLDEASKSLGGIADACVYGAGETQANWKVADCSQQIAITDEQGVRDPYNYSGTQRGTHRRIPIASANSSNWFLTGAFNFMDDSQIQTNCAAKGKFFGDEKSACFRPVYLAKYLQSVQIPASAQKADASWTLGAVICTASHCLKKASAPICRWSDKGCL
jgi:hypothetical protein